MSETKTLKGTIQLVEKDIQIPKKAGGSYPGTRITFLGFNGQASNQAFHQVQLKKNPGLLADINALEAGDNVVFTYVINEKGFRDFSSIKKDDGTAVTTTAPTAKATKKTANNDYATGAIKGNSVSNAVNICIAEGDTSIDNLKAKYDLLIDLHAYAEERGIESKKTEAKADDADADLTGEAF